MSIKEKGYVKSASNMRLPYFLFDYSSNVELYICISI